MRSKLACSFLGSLVHTAVLLAPLAATGRLASAAADWPVVALVLMAGAFYLAELSAMEHAERRARPPALRIDRLARRLALCSCLAVLAVFWTALLERAAGPVSFAWHQALGFVMMPAGIAMRRAAIGRLGERFVTSVSADGRCELVDEGVYARVRHPSETGLLLVTLGAAILLGSSAAAAVWCAVLLPLTLARIGIEDRCLSRAFGGEFRSYRRRVRALVPFLF
jgi:protein-S-isoprenylcysteine O-methyltransferase Ste14